MTDAIDLTSLRRHDIHDFLPTDAKGRLQRSRILTQFELDDWKDRPSLTVFAGSRVGKNTDFALAAAEFGRLTAEHDIGLVTGGAPDKILGLMSAVADFNDNLIGVSPEQFADRRGVSSGISPRAINLITYDFYIRKILMHLLGDASAVLPGGFGSLEEAVEAEIFSRYKTVHYLNLDGCWSDLLSQYQTLSSLGLFPNSLRARTVSPTAAIAFGHIDYEFRHVARRMMNESSEIILEGVSLQSFLRQNPHHVSQEIFKFAGNSPRVGVVVSGNISEDSGRSKLKDRKLTDEFCKESARLGREIALDGGVLVLSGGRDGLREIMAKAAVRAGGRVIWIQRKRNLSEPLVITKGYDREMTITVRREFEKAMMFDLISQATGFLPGGIHTIDRVFEIITREQTGFAGINSYKFMIGGADAVRSMDIPTRASSPVLGFNIGGIWSDLVRQVSTFHKLGFIEDKDLSLFTMLDQRESLARALIAQARKMNNSSYDLLRKIDELAPTTPQGLNAAPRLGFSAKL